MLSQPVLSGLRNAGFVQPSPVQMLAIPPAKLGFDLIVQSKSGTGKTAVYVVAALEMVKASVAGLQCLVVAPTREIAVQGATVAMQLGANMPGLKVAAFIGGINLAEDKVKARNCHLGVGTPGRLKQLLTEGMLPAESVRLVVMDEADKLLEPAFLNDTTDILNLMPKSRQVLALSATYPDQLASIAERFMRSPQHIRPGKASQVLTGVSQFLLPVDRSPAAARQTALKHAALLNVLSSVPYSQALVFSNYSTIAQSTSDFLNSRGFPAVFMSSGQDQTRRNAVIQTFKQFSCRILCSTDLTARGIDAENVNLVVNLEVPWEHNTYLHRIGRGGRFGSLSIAITLASEGEETDKLKAIVAKTGSIIRVMSEVIPQDLRSVMADMEVLEAKEKVVKEKLDPEKKKVIESANEERTIKPNSETADKSGKIKRRGKKKANEKDEEAQNIANKPDNREVMDTAIIKRMVGQLMKDCEATTLKIDMADIEEIVDKLERGEEVGQPGHREVEEEGEEALRRLEDAVKRKGAAAREKHRELIEKGRRMTKGKTRREILEAMLVDEQDERITSCEENSSEDEKIENQGEFKTKGKSLADIKDNLSSEDSSEDSSSEDDEDSSSSSEDDDDDRGNPLWPPNQHLQHQSLHHPHQQQSHPQFPPSQFPQYPNPWQHQANLAWYQNWYASVQLQRQQVEWQTYWAELARKKPRK